MSEKKTSTRERAAQFVGRLRALTEDRGKLAALRRGRSAGTVMDAWPVIASLGGDIGPPGESVHVDIGALFAVHPEVRDEGNFGQTCRRISLADSTDKQLPESYERRFRRLLSSSDQADLTGQLRPWIRHAAKQGIAVNYESLFTDLRNWRWYAEDIRVRWAKSFWSAEETSTEPTQTKKTAS